MNRVAVIATNTIFAFFVRGGALDLPSYTLRLSSCDTLAWLFILLSERSGSD